MEVSLLVVVSLDRRLPDFEASRADGTIVEKPLVVPLSLTITGSISGGLDRSGIYSSV